MSVLYCSPLCVATQRDVLPHRCVPCGNGGAGRRYVQMKMRALARMANYVSYRMGPRLRGVADAASEVR